jgi:hypothetical protein
MVLLMRLFYSHVHSLFQHTSCRQTNGDDPPTTGNCLTIITQAMNLEKPRDYNVILNLSKLAPTIKAIDLI